MMNQTVLRSLYLSLLLLAAACNSQAQTPAAAPAQPSGAPAPPGIASRPIATSPLPVPLRDALNLVHQKKFTEAESAYKAILETNPRSALAYVGLTHLYLDQDRVADADDAVSKATSLTSTSDAVRVAKGEVLFRQGHIPEAQDQFTPLVKANTQEARAYLGLGTIYWAQSYYRHAKLMFDKAHERDPDDPEIRSRWFYTEDRKQPNEPAPVTSASTSSSPAIPSDADESDPFQMRLIPPDETTDEPNKGCRLVSNASEAHLSLEKLLYSGQRMRGYGLKVQIGDAKATLLLDTGASGILIKRKLAEKAGIQSSRKTPIWGIGDKGPVAGHVGIADSIKMGNLEFKGCAVEVDERSSVADEDGLIGADIFNHFLVDINFPDQKFDLTPLPPLPPPSDTEKALIAKYPDIARFHDRVIPTEYKSFTPIYRFGHMLLIPTRINELPSKLFLIDTGAFSDTISPAAAREVTKVHSDSDSLIKGLSGSVKHVYTADELILTFSRFRQPASDIFAFDTTAMSRSAGTEISGLLGFAMFYQMDIKIDYRDGLVDFNHDPNRLY